MNCNIATLLGIIYSEEVKYFYAVYKGIHSKHILIPFSCTEGNFANLSQHLIAEIGADWVKSQSHFKTRNIPSKLNYIILGNDVVWE